MLVAGARHAGAPTASPRPRSAIADELRLDAAVLHFGVDLDAFTPTPLPDGPPQALVLGALVGWKRPDLALEIARRMPDVHVTFAGAPLPGEDYTPDAPPNVTFAGHVTDVRDGARAAPTCCCTAPTPSRTASRWSRRSPPAARSSRPRRAARSRSSRTAPAGCTRPGTPTRPCEALRAVLADPEAPHAARRRAEAAFDVRDSVRRLAAAIDTAIIARRRPPSDVTVGG